MFRHYIKTVVRNFYWQKLNSGINIIGLTLGLGISLLIWIFVLHQLSYDKFFTDHQNIYRVHATIESGQGEPRIVPRSMFFLAEHAHDNLPEIESFCRFTTYWGSPEVIIDGQTATLPGMLLGDENFFSLFDFEFLAGNALDPLPTPQDIVLTETTANRLFGNVHDALNRVISVANNTYQVSAVLKDLPENTHFTFNAYARHENLQAGAKASGTNFFTYLKLGKDTDKKALAQKFDTMIEEHVRTNPLYGGVTTRHRVHFVALGDIHLHSNLIWEMKDNGNYKNVMVFGFLGIFILLIAIINYVNLTTARSTLRAKEIGMRKVVGASRMGLIRQILTESLVITLFSFLLAFAFTEIMTSLFSSALGISLSTGILFSTQGILVLLSIFIITTLLAGLYPAFFMSSFNAIKTLKGETVRGKKGRLMRQALVVFQFAITIFILSSLIVINRQMNHMQNHDLGFGQQQLILVRNLSSAIWKSFPEMRAQMETLSRVESAAGANFIYGGPNRVDLIKEQGMDSNSGVSADFLTVDHHFLDVMGIKILQGRNFHADSEFDQAEALILNQSAVSALGFEDPLDKNLEHFVYKGKLIGVINDFHHKSLHQDIGPLVLVNARAGFPHVYMKVNPGSFEQLTQDLTKVFHVFDPFYIPDIIFMDERIQNLYQKEHNQASLLSWGAFLAIIISILGVYGLASFSAQRRVKEIGIRKVLGASLSQLLWIFNKESITLVILAFVVAAPLAWYAMNSWLENFAVRVNINLAWFIIPATLTLLLSSSTISLQAWLTARANPVDSLRNE